MSTFRKRAIFAPQPATVRGQPVRLGSDHQGKKVVYGNGRNVVVRDLANPGECWLYSEHVAPVTVARFSPSGYYCASADTQGNVRIWDTVNEEHVLKFECKPISGRITDLAWDCDSKRIAVAGEGKNKFAAAFMFDSGASVGEILGHSKVINAISVRQVRPFRAATASDDATVNFYEGVPYKFNQSHSSAHTRFVQDVRFSPDGAYFVSVGMDGKVILFDGKTGEKVSELSSDPNSHTGGIYSVSWSRDSKRLITSSADMTVKLWDLAAGGSGSVAHTWTFADSPSLENQQVGNLWGAEHIVSLDYAGSFNYLSPEQERPVRVVRGHQRAITAFAAGGDVEGDTFYSGDYEGKVFKWSVSVGQPMPVAGPGHGSQVIQMTLNNRSKSLATIGLDDSLREIDLLDSSFSQASISTKSMPRSVACAGQMVFVSNGSSVLIRNGGAIVAEFPTEQFTTSAIAASALPNDEFEVALGGEDAKVRLYKYSASDKTFALTHTLTGGKGAITCISYASQPHKLLAVADAARQINVFDTETKELKLHQWCFHTSKVTSFAWAPNGQHAASGSLDTNVYVWSVAKPMKHVAIKGAHLDGVNGVAWLNDSTLASAGQDATIKIWQLDLQV